MADDVNDGIRRFDVSLLAEIQLFAVLDLISILHWQGYSGRVRDNLVWFIG